MGGEATTHIPAIELTLFWMLLAVVAVALLTRRIGLPYTVALVLAGLVLAVVPGTPNVELTPELILAVFLPTLIFEAAYNLDFNHLRENLRSITILAVPGVLLTASVVAAAIHFLGGMDWTIAFLFGAIVSATDPVSVVATFKALGAPARLRTILEGESLFNDGTAIVLFNLIMGILLAGQFSIVESVGNFALVVVGGLLIGLAVGYGAALLLSRVDEYLLETVVTLVVAYGTYLLAEELDVSGVIAVVTAGLLLGNYGQRISFSPTTKIAISVSWDLFGFLANSLIFLFVGLQLRVARLDTAVGPVVLAIGAVLMSRVVVVGLTGALLKRGGIERPVPWSWQIVLMWGGLRGAVSLALALSLPGLLGNAPDGSPIRETLLAMTFGVILFSLLVEGLTMQPLLRRLKVVGRGQDLEAYERAQAELSAIRAALDLLEARTRRGEVVPDVAAELRQEYTEREAAAQEQLQHLNLENTDLRRAALITQRRAMLQVEKSTLRSLFTRGTIDEETLRTLQSAIDSRLHEAEQSAESLDAPAPAEIA